MSEASTNTTRGAFYLGNATDIASTTCCLVVSNVCTASRNHTTSCDSLVFESDRETFCKAW